MKAVRFHDYGTPDVLKYEDVPRPILEKGDALIKVIHCGTNRFDTRIRFGSFKTYVPHILGTDVVGEVVELASESRDLKVGDRVVAYHIMNDENCLHCLSGRQNICNHSHMLGAYLDGGYAEFMKIRASNLLKIDELHSEIAACLPMNFGVAWNGLVSKANMNGTEIVLVWGASSGVGSAAIKIAKLLGATVISTASSPEKLDHAKKLGSDYVINHRTEDVSAMVMSLTNNRGADIAFDHIGQGTWSKSIDSLSKGGTLVVLGVTGGSKAEAEVGKVYHKELTIRGVYGCSKGDLKKVISLSQEGKISPVIDKELPLERAREAHEIIESGNKFGKILLKP